MRDITKQRIVMMLENSITMVCFTGLAVRFEKWWIIFFSLLFISYERRRDN